MHLAYKLNFDCHLLAKGTGSCPIKDTVKICLPKCLSDFECVGYRRCCPNSCGTMSCADVSPVSAGNDPRNPIYEGKTSSSFQSYRFAKFAKMVLYSTAPTVAV